MQTKQTKKCKLCKRKNANNLDWARSHHQRHGCGLPGQGDPDHYRAQVRSSTIVLEFLMVIEAKISVRTRKMNLTNYQEDGGDRPGVKRHCGRSYQAEV